LVEQSEEFFFLNFNTQGYLFAVGFAPASISIEPTEIVHISIWYFFLITYLLKISQKILGERTISLEL
jgi:hypothetical protein